MAETPGLEAALIVIGARIAAKRKSMGLSQEKFADACGVHRTFMGAIERGESNMSMKSLMHVARALSVDASELVIGLPEDEEKPVPRKVIVISLPPDLGAASGNKHD